MHSERWGWFLKEYIAIIHGGKQSRWDIYPHSSNTKINDMIQSLRLAKVIFEICEPGTFNEWDCPLVIAMYHCYCWRERLSEWFCIAGSQMISVKHFLNMYQILLILYSHTNFIYFIFHSGQNWQGFSMCRSRVVYILSQYRWIFDSLHCPSFHCFFLAKFSQLFGSLACLVYASTSAS